MIPSLRKAFNEAFDEEQYARLKLSLGETAGCPISFRIAESPLFLPHDFAAKAARLAEEIFERAASPELQKIGNTAVPADFRYASETARPLFGAVDFAISGSRENPELKLIELQGFPSLYHFQPAFSKTARDTYGLPSELTGLLRPEMGYEVYYRTLSELILAGEDPETVVLMELGPFNQKTLPDFLLAYKHLGIAIVDIGDIETKGRDLYYRTSDNKLRPIRRIYNRSIHDELVQKGARIPFDITKEYNVSWAGHPNWYFKISKVLLPHLVGTNEAVPDAWLISDIDATKLDLENFVLKPLYSFAGAGVIVGPTLEDIQGISTYAREHWLLQERVHYIEAFTTPDGHGVKAELRVMLGWPEHADHPVALHTLVRLTRGKMVGVDHNRGLDWVGSSCALVPLAG